MLLWDQDFGQPDRQTEGKPRLPSSVNVVPGNKYVLGDL